MSEMYKIERYETEPRFSGCSTYQKIEITNRYKKTPEISKICERFREMINLREKYVYTPQKKHPNYPIEETTNTKIDLEKLPQKLPKALTLEAGVFYVDDLSGGSKSERISSEKFFEELSALMDFVSEGAPKSLAFNRLKILAAKFDLHVLLNEANELEEVKSMPHRDFYNSYKVDNHVHHSACMNQKQFLRFVKRKIRGEKDTVVKVDKDGKPQTLGEVSESLGITGYNLSIDVLDMHAHKQTFHRFDKFNKKYNPVGSSQLRTIFLKTSNHIKGRFLAEITREVFMYLEEQKYQFTEYRLSIYGKNANEWSQLAAWVVDNGLQTPKNMWMIQIPRLFEVYKTNNLIDSFQDMLSFIFKPMFEATLDPASNPKLFKFLQLICGFDTVDDESVLEKRDYTTKPQEWVGEDNPPYAIYAFYIYANLVSLNNLREQRGLNTFSFRPHAGESGSIEHLAITYILCNSINHGILLKKSPTLCYLYYLSQVGISISPLSNNILFLKHSKHPFPSFFRTGLNVALSTDDPLMIHFTKDPLIEEYSVAAQIWNLSKTDLSEIAANSVYQSGFDERVKAQWYGKGHSRFSCKTEHCQNKNLSKIRVSFRENLYQEEFEFIQGEAVLVNED